MCHIFDVEILSSSIWHSDESLADSSRSSFSHYDTSSHESQSSEELFLITQTSYDQFFF